jgi:hypothetical protein
METIYHLRLRVIEQIEQSAGRPPVYVVEANGQIHKISSDALAIINRLAGSGT